MLASGETELTAKQYTALAGEGVSFEADTRTRRGDLDADWLGGSGAVFVFLDAEGRLHREGGPAVDRADGRQEWWYHGRLHSFDGRPAVVDPSGVYEWYEFDLRHRVPGPAVIYANGRQDFWVNGQRHRLHGPAIQRPPGQEDEWYIDGVQVQPPEVAA
jgi:hypothetical protein